MTAAKHPRLEERRRIFEDWKVVVGQAFLQATLDPLTGLPNRSLFHDRLRIALSESKGRQETFGVLFVDLDRFKVINDLLGHDAGDRLLVTAGLRLSQVVRSEETVARMGGDEFAVLVRCLPTPHQAGIVANRLLKALAPPIVLEERLFTLTASIGISLYPLDGEEGTPLLKRADAAMFRVKRQGGNGWEFFEQPSDRKYKERSGPKEKAKPKQTILIIDDDADFRFVLRNRLEQEGYSCIAADGVREALKRVHIDSPDLVILDLGLRQASGIAFLQNLVKTVAPAEKIPPVLVVSGHRDPEIVEFAILMGACRFIPKPVGYSEIVSAVRTYIP
jgi:diguanylate cyclase (GGDEF)-like protein